MLEFFFEFFQTKNFDLHAETGIIPFFAVPEDAGRFDGKSGFAPCTTGTVTCMLVNRTFCVFPDAIAGKTKVTSCQIISPRPTQLKSTYHYHPIHGVLATGKYVSEYPRNALQSSVLQKAGVDSFASWAQSLGKRSRRLHRRAQQAQHFLYAQSLGERSHYRMSVHAISTPNRFESSQD
jgi:hypothetical protein